MQFKKPVRGECRTKTKEDVVELLGTLAPWYTDEEIAKIFNCQGLKTGNANAWNRVRVHALRSQRAIPACDRIKSLTLNEAARQLGDSPNTVRTLIRKGVIHAQQIVKFAPFMIARSEHEKEDVGKAMDQLRNGRSARAIGVVSKDQLSLYQ